MWADDDAGGGQNRSAGLLGEARIEAQLKNFRDIGGYRSSFGGAVRTGRVFRSAQPSEAGPQALAELLALDFRLIADLRHPDEQAGAPSPWPADYAGRIVRHTQAEAGLEAPHLAIMAMRPRDVEMADAYYLRLYEELPYDRAYQRLFATVLKTLAALDGPALVHCTLGKDRTGILVALIHSALGVCWRDILADFMKSGASNDFGPNQAEALEQVRLAFRFEMPTAVLSRLISVQEAYLPRFFRAVRSRSGGVDGYLDEIGVTKDVREGLCSVMLDR